MSFFSTDKPSTEDGHINVIAEIQAQPEHLAEARALLESLVEPSRTEDGCKGSGEQEGSFELLYL